MKSEKNSLSDRIFNMTIALVYFLLTALNWKTRVPILIFLICSYPMLTWIRIFFNRSLQGRHNVFSSFFYMLSTSIKC